MARRKRIQVTGRVFIIHSPTDKELVRDIERRLRIAGLEPLGYDDELPDLGEYKKRLLNRVRKADAVLVLVTPAALASAWVMSELGMAEGFDKRIIPVTAGLDDRSLPGPLIDYHSVPFDQLDAAICEIARNLSGPLAS